MQWCCNPPDTKSPATYLYLSSSANCDHIGFFAEVNGVSDGDADYDADIYYDADGDGGAWRRTMSYLPLSSSSRRARILKWVQLYTALDFIWVKHPLMPLWRSRPSIPWEKNRHLFAFSTPLLHRHDSQTQLNECWQNQFLPTWKRFSGRPLKGQWHKYCELPIEHCKSHSSANYPSLVRPARLSRDPPAASFDIASMGHILHWRLTFYVRNQFFLCILANLTILLTDVYNLD